MNFRTVVRDGLIIVNTHGALPDGTPVEVSVSKKPRSSKVPARRKSGRVKKSGHVPGYGMWADRDELGAADEAVNRLRNLTRRRKVG